MVFTYLSVYINSYCKIFKHLIHMHHIPNKYNYVLVYNQWHWQLYNYAVYVCHTIRKLIVVWALNGKRFKHRPRHYCLPSFFDVLDSLCEQVIGLLERFKQLFEVDNWFSKFFQQNLLELCKSCSLHGCLWTHNMQTLFLSTYITRHSAHKDF